MTDERSGGPWRVNGKTGAGWRIDSLDGSRVGLDFLQHPVALVPSKGDADAIACLPELVERVEAVLAVSPEGCLLPLGAALEELSAVYRRMGGAR